MNRTRVGLIGLLVVAVVAAALLVGRGLGGDDSSSSDQDAVRQVMTDLQTASRDGDGQRICNQIFTPKLSNSVTRSSASGSCATEVKSKLFSPQTQIEVETVAVTDESNATVIVKEANGNTSTVFLVKQSGLWRIRSVTPA
jgi:hypothetical protein